MADVYFNSHIFSTNDLEIMKTLFIFAPTREKHEEE